MSGGAGSVKLGIARTEWSKGRKRRVPDWSGWSWLRLESERGCVSPAHGEHNTVRRAVQRAAREMIPERARGLLFWGLMCPALSFQRLHALTACAAAEPRLRSWFQTFRNMNMKLQVSWIRACGTGDRRGTRCRQCGVFAVTLIADIGSGVGQRQ